MTRIFLPALLLCTYLAAFAQENMKLYLFNFSTDSLSSPVLIDSSGLVETDPVFDQQRTVLYYIRTVNGSFQIISYDYQTDSSKVIVASPYALSVLRVTPDGKHLTCIRKDRGASEIIQYPIGGGDFSSVISHSLENYLWIDDNNLLIAEPGKPNTLQLLSLRPQKKIPIARHVGKALAHSRKRDLFAFVHKLSVDSWSVKTIGADGGITIYAETLPEAEVLTLTPDGTPLLSADGQIYMHEAGKKRWKLLPANISLGDVSALQINWTATRLAVISKNITSTNQYGN
jgi:hypothetical protein